MSHVDVHTVAQGKWRGILLQLGVEDRYLKNKHGPCPICNAGTDRFRFDDKGGRGTYYCSQCGAGNGIELLMGVRGWAFREAADAVREVVGVVQPSEPKPEMTEAKRREMLKRLWKDSGPVQQGDVTDRYLQARGVGELVYPDSLRTCPNCYHSDGKSFPAMVALVVDVEGKGVTLHRTYLGDGCKADVNPSRKLMVGKMGDGACVRLGGVVDGKVQEEIGIAEGIETALAAMQRFELPVWATISANGMQNWIPPVGVKTVWIFGDNDTSHTGQAAAYMLAKRLHAKGIEAHVKIPETIGSDWADHAKDAV